MVFMATEKVNQDSEKLMSKIFAWAANKASVAGPVPMDVGRVAYSHYDDGCWCEEPHEEMDVGVVGGSATCYTRGGWGHMSRECPTQKKGKGK